MKKRFIPAILSVFVVLTAIFYGMKQYAPAYRFNVMMAGNIMIALLSLISYVIVTNQLKGRPQAFVRGVYASSYLKLLVCLVSILAYVMINKPDIHKPTLFVLFGIYAVYSIIETAMLSRLAKDVK